MTAGEDRRPHRFDHQDRYGGGFRADHGLGSHIGLGRDLAELAILVGTGMFSRVRMRMRGSQVAEQAEQVKHERADQEPAGRQRESGDSAHTWDQYIT